MKKLRMVLLITLLMSLCIGSLFAGGFALSGVGSKAIGLGGAFRGMSDDPTAVYWNPGGLGFMNKNYLSIAGAGILPLAEFTNSNPNLPGFTTDPVEAKTILHLFPNLYAIKGGGCNFKYGLGIYIPYGLGATWDMYDLPTGTFNLVTPTDTVATAITWSDGFPKEEMMSSIGIVDIHPTFAYKFSEMFSLGAGLSIYYSMIEIDKVKPHAIYSYNLPTTMELEGTGIGFGGNIGMMFKFSDNAQVGLTGKLPAKIKLEGEAVVRTWLSNYINYAMHMPGVNPNAHLYAVPAVLGDTTDIKATLNLPGDIGWGVSFKLNPRWTLNTDFSYAFWNVLNEVKIEFDPAAVIGTTTLEESELVTKWEDTFRISIGTEYRFPKVALRGGFFYDESPVPSNTLNPTLPDISDKYSGNIGLGFTLGKWLLDLNYEYIMFDERKIETQTSENMVGTYNNSVNAFNFGLTYTF